MEHLEQLEQKIDDLTKALNRISFHLFNDDGAGMVGTIKKVDQLQERVKGLEDVNKIKNARVAIFSTIGGGLVIAAKELFILLKHL